MRDMVEKQDPIDGGKNVFDHERRKGVRHGTRLQVARDYRRPMRMRVSAEQGLAPSA